MMTQKAFTTALLVLALVASVSDAKPFQQQYQQQYQQQPVQVQRGTPGLQRISGYTNVTMTDEQKAKPSTGASFYNSAGGVAVRSTFTNSPAQKAGMVSGDIITMVNGKALQNVEALNAMIGKMASGDVLKMTKRNARGKETDVSLALMTTEEVMNASIVPEAGVYDQAVSQADIQLQRMAQQIKNTKEDLAELEKNYEAMKQRMADFQAKAKAARMEADKQKAAAEKARMMQIEEMKKKAEEEANK